MADLDRLLELKERYSILDNIGKNLSSSEFQEYQSLYYKLKKAEEDGKKFNDLEKAHEDMLYNMVTREELIFLKQNQKTPEDIEKIEWINKSGYNFSQLNMMLANYQKRCQSIDEITKGQEEWKLKYFDLQKEIQKLSKDNKQLKEEIIILKSASSYDAKSIIKLQQDSKTNVEIVEKIKEEIGSLDLALDSFDDDSEIYNILYTLKMKLQSILKETK